MVTILWDSWIIVLAVYRRQRGACSLILRVPFSCAQPAPKGVGRVAGYWQVLTKSSAWFARDSLNSLHVDDSGNTLGHGSIPRFQRTFRRVRVAFPTLTGGEELIISRELVWPWMELGIASVAVLVAVAATLYCR